MAFVSSPHAPPAGAARLAAVLVCALALGLLVWRGAALLTGPGAATGASPAEAALADVIAPVAGPGLSRVSLAWNAEGGRTLLILLDETATLRLAELQRIAPLAAGLDTGRGDRLVIETVAFAGGLPGRPDAAAWAELAALAGLVLLGCVLVVKTRHAASAAVQVAPAVPAPALTERARGEVRPLRTVTPALPGEAAEIVRRDPARAALVVRGWMNSKDEPA